MQFHTDEYIYAVSRIRCKENKLLSAKNIDQLISLPDEASVKRYLSEYGWELSTDSSSDILEVEQEALWKLMKELVGDLSIFDFFRIQNDFHNLKAAVKAIYSDCEPDSMFLSGSVYDPSDIYTAVKNKEYGDLPVYLKNTAEEAMSTLLKTGDGQLCDTIIDKACLSAVNKFGVSISDSCIKEYCKVFVACGNIKIAVRGSRVQKTADFIYRSMAECDGLDIKSLSTAASKGFDEVCDYLSCTDYKNAVEYIRESLSSFEKWCDNHIIKVMKSQKSEPFSIGPLVAYVIAKQTEIKAVRLILTAKINDLDDSIISERIRDMYV